MFIEMFVIIVVKLKIILWCFVFLGINILYVELERSVNIEWNFFFVWLNL